MMPAHCDRCGDVPALPFRGTPLCPACTAQVGLEEAAAAHLHELMTPVVRQWAAHWAHTFRPVELAALLACEGEAWSGPAGEPDENALAYLHRITGGQA